MKRGDTIKWKSSDGDGNYTHTGIIEKVTEKAVTFKTLSGVFTVPLNDGSFELLKDSKETEEVRAEPKVEHSEAQSAVVTRNNTSTPSAKQGSKLERAIALAKTMPNASQKDMIAAFMEKLDMSKAGATTYFYNVKKKL